MPSKHRTHYRTDASESEAVCGCATRRITQFLSLVTCKNCRRLVRLWVAVWSDCSIANALKGVDDYGSSERRG